MPNNTLEKWEEKTIGELCSLVTGGTPNTKNENYYKNGTIKWLVSGDIHKKIIYDCSGRITEDGYNNSNAKYLPIDSVLIALNGQGKTRGTVALLKTEATCNQSIVSIMPNNQGQLLSSYLYHYLDAKYRKIREMTGDGGNDRRGLNMPLIKSIKIKYPISINEQEHIVKFLNTILENIEKAKQNTLQNLNNAKELFESYLDEVFTKNTDNWNKYKVKDVCEYAKEQGHYNLPYVGMEHIKSSTAEFIGTLDNTEVKSTTFHFDKGIILYGRLRPYLRKVILTTFEGHCSTELFPIKVNDKVNNKFLMYWLLSQRITDKINETWTGARMPRANMNKVLEFDISIPSITEQQKIVSQLDKLLEQTKKLEQIYTQKLQDLDELKQSILQKAFNGEL